MASARAGRSLADTPGRRKRGRPTLGRPPWMTHRWHARDLARHKRSDRMRPFADRARTRPAGGPLMPGIVAPRFADPAHPLRRRLGLFDTTMIVMGGIVGSGIFMNPYVVARRVHTPFLILAAWTAGGLIALSERYEQILSYVVSVDWIFFGLAASCVFVLRRRDRRQGGPVRVEHGIPGHPVT